MASKPKKSKLSSVQLVESTPGACVAVKVFGDGKVGYVHSSGQRPPLAYLACLPNRQPLTLSSQEACLFESFHIDNRGCVVVASCTTYHGSGKCRPTLMAPSNYSPNDRQAILPFTDLGRLLYYEGVLTVLTKEGHILVKKKLIEDIRYMPSSQWDNLTYHNTCIRNPDQVVAIGSSPNWLRLVIAYKSGDVHVTAEDCKEIKWAFRSKIVGSLSGPPIAVTLDSSYAVYAILDQKPGIIRLANGTTSVIDTAEKIPKCLDLDEHSQSIYFGSANGVHKVRCTALPMIRNPNRPTPPMALDNLFDAFSAFNQSTSRDSVDFVKFGQSKYPKGFVKHRCPPLVSGAIDSQELVRRLSPTTLALFDYYFFTDNIAWPKDSSHSELIELAVCVVIAPPTDLLSPNSCYSLVPWKEP